MPHRTSRVLATGAACLTLLLSGAGVASAGVPSAGTGAGTACSGTVRITAFAFQPPEAAPGGSSTATLTAKNCTATSQTVSETWYGRFSGPTTGIPTGCPVLDPFLRPVTLAPHAKATTSTGYNVPTGCTATQLAVTVSITNATGTVLAQQTADLLID
ncbi:hypothetical protein [Streptacidiphilus cavernicola]|uniref:Ig-like domain-containing protein n=1 Tax=Streptacidiphilus cavernicola TaxID=3342716 RepID=A0ABV6VYP3_9ACTN